MTYTIRFNEIADRYELVLLDRSPVAAVAERIGDAAARVGLVITASRFHRVVRDRERFVIPLDRETARAIDAEYVEMIENGVR